MAKESAVKREWTTQDLADVRDDYLNRVELVYNKFDELSQGNPNIKKGDNEVYKKQMLERLEYSMTIKTEEEWEKQQERCENIISMGGVLDMPLVVILDPQILQERVFEKGDYPTYYSTWIKQDLFENGNPGFVIAYPPRITEMTDDEVWIALQHEFGHIKQKHMFLSRNDPARNSPDLNKAMDYSINWGFNHEDITLYEELARKMFDGQTGVTKVPFPKEKGGLNNNVNISHDWQEVLDLMEALQDKKDDDDKGGDGEQPPEEIEIGDIIIERKKGGGYARVSDIDEKTGKITADPMTKEEFEEARKEEAQKQGPGKGGHI